MLRLLKQIICGCSSGVSRLSVVLALLGTGGLWLVDVALVHWLNGIESLENGFFSVDVSRGYHIGLYLATAALWISALRK